MLQIVYFFLNGTQSNTICQDTNKTKISFFDKVYLKNFYTLANKSRNTFEERLREMQRFFGMRVTGRLDNGTMTMMKTPRCGMPDMAAVRAVPGRPRWRQTSLTYR